MIADVRRCEGLGRGRSGARVVLVTGAPGVGKTDVSRLLVSRFSGPAALIETDALGATHPFEVDDAFVELVGRNLEAVLPNMVAWGARTVVVAGVARRAAIFDLVASCCARLGATLEIFVLWASAATIQERIRSDHKIQDRAQRMKWTLLDEELAALPGAVVLDTENEPIERVVRDLEAALAPQAAPLAPRPAQQRERVVSVAEAEHAVTAALRVAGVGRAAAEAVAAHLVDAEVAGVASHGVLRVPEYLDQLDRGVLAATASPVVLECGAVTTIDGNRCLGVLAVGPIVDGLLRGGPSDVAITAVRNCGHLGRLGPIGAEVARRGRMVLGFVNFQGGGQRVAPVGATDGRLATNPILFAAPMPTGPPIVVDLSTSSTSEGSIRTRWLAGDLIEAGHLVDAGGAPVYDPGRFYGSPPSAWMVPLGGPSGHKGYALGLMVEVLAGALAGAGVVDAGVNAEGNGGLFASLPLGLVRAAEEVLNDLTRIEAHLRSEAPPGATVRFPGRIAQAGSRGAGTIRVPVSLWDAIVDAGRGADA